MNIEALVAEYGSVMKSYGRSLGVGDRVIAIDHSGSADRRFAAIRNALTEQAETHAIEMRAYEATVANLNERIRQLEAERVPHISIEQTIKLASLWGYSVDEAHETIEQLREVMLAAVPQQKEGA